MAWTPNRCEVCGEVPAFTVTSQLAAVPSPARRVSLPLSGLEFSRPVGLTLTARLQAEVLPYLGH